MGGWQEWFKVRAALDDREWDFRTVGGIAGKPDWPRTPWYGCSAKHRSELRQILLRDGRIGYTLKSRPKTLREVFAEIQMFARP